MKKIVLIFFLIGYDCSIIQSQSNNPEARVYETNKIYFYGYDFSHFHLADAKRYGQDIKVYLFNLMGSIQEKIGEPQIKKMAPKRFCHF